MYVQIAIVIDEEAYQDYEIYLFLYLHLPYLSCYFSCKYFYCRLV